MRSLVCLCVLLWAASAGAEVKLTLRANNRDIGSAESSQRVSATRGRIVELRLTLKTGNKSVVVHTTSTFDASGAPVRKVQETLRSDHDQRVVIATFDSAGANVVINDGAARKTQRVPIEAASPRQDVAGFWFLRDHPAVGAHARQYAFNMDLLQWELTETTYEGDTTMRVGSKDVGAHRVKTTVGERVTTCYLDDKGEPIRIEAGNIVMQRA